MLLYGKAKDEFNVEPITSAEVRNMIERCGRIYKGSPDWANEEDHIKTINFAKALCSETARLVTLGIGIHVEGSARAEWLQEQIDNVYFQLRQWVEYGCAFGTVVLKPNGKSIDLYTYGDFWVTSQENGEIDGAVFVDRETDETTRKYYTRMEYHRFENGVYTVSNRCFVGDSENDVTKRIDIKLTPWAGMLEDVSIENVDKPLFAVFRTPHANNLDINSAVALPVFTDAIEELRDLDVAYSRNAKEIADSKRIVLLDSDRMIPFDSRVTDTVNNAAQVRAAMGLPDTVKNVYGDGRETFYQEINPSLNTDMRLSGINALLSQIGYKVGYSNGYFVFNESSGIQTATGVEAEQQRTIQFIKDVRDKLESCINDLLYALNAFADLYGLAPVGAYEAVYDFGDITYNREDDKARWYGYVTAGKIPFWYFLAKFEGYTEEEARALEKAAAPQEPTLFGSEE